MIAQAVRDGLFEIPRGKDGAFSESQFSDVHRWLAMLPICSIAVERAASFMDSMGQRSTTPLFELFGHLTRGRLPCPLSQAKGLPYSCPRKPWDFKAGTFGPSEFINLVDDINATGKALIEYIDLLESPGFFNQNQPLAPKVERLRQADQLHLLQPLIASVHKIRLWRDGERELDKVRYHGKDISHFLDYIRLRAEREQREASEHWSSTFRMIRNVSGVLADATGYSQGNLTRTLRKELGQQFAVVYQAPPNQTGFYVKTDCHLELGKGHGISSTFELINWLAALEDSISTATLDVNGYWHSVAQANERLQIMRTSLADTDTKAN